MYLFSVAVLLLQRVWSFSLGSLQLFPWQLGWFFMANLQILNGLIPFILLRSIKWLYTNNSWGLVCWAYEPYSWKRSINISKFSLNWVLLLQYLNYVSGFRLQLVYTYWNHYIKPHYLLLVLLPFLNNLVFFHLYQQNRPAGSEAKFWWVSSITKRFLNLENFLMLLKQGSQLLPETWLSWLFLNCI